MKRKIIFGVVFFALFVCLAQAIFAQSNIIVLRVDDAHLWTNGNRESITDRVSGASMSAEPGSMMIMVAFKDGSYLTYQFTDSSRRSDGGWSLRNGTRSNSLGGNFTGNYSGEFSPFMVNGVQYGYSIEIFVGYRQDQRELMLAVQGL